MPSRSLTTWSADARRALDEIEAAHRAVGRAGPGSRYAAQQINQAYVLLLSSRFQRFCRDLHTECIEALIREMEPATLKVMVQRQMMSGRKLDTGNPNPGNIGSDFNRFAISFWPALIQHDERNGARQRLLAGMNQRRNAVAHQDFTPAGLGGRDRLTLAEVRGWRGACEQLAVDFERVMYDFLSSITGSEPW